jgi:hypothetical protein
VSVEASWAAHQTPPRHHHTDSAYVCVRVRVGRRRRRGSSLAKMARGDGGKAEDRRMRVLTCADAGRRRRVSRGVCVTSGEGADPHLQDQDGVCVWMEAFRRRLRRREGSCSSRLEAAARWMRRGSSPRARNRGGGCVEGGGRLRRCRLHRTCLCPAEREACSGSCLEAGHDGDESRRGHPRKQTWAIYFALQ